MSHVSLHLEKQLQLYCSDHHIPADYIFGFTSSISMVLNRFQILHLFICLDGHFSRLFFRPSTEAGVIHWGSSWTRNLFHFVVEGSCLSFLTKFISFVLHCRKITRFGNIWDTDLKGTYMLHTSLLNKMGSGSTAPASFQWLLSFQKLNQFFIQWPVVAVSIVSSEFPCFQGFLPYIVLMEYYGIVLQWKRIVLNYLLAIWQEGNFQSRELRQLQDLVVYLELLQEGCPWFLGNYQNAGGHPALSYPVHSNKYTTQLLHMSKFELEWIIMDP